MTYSTTLSKAAAKWSPDVPYWTVQALTQKKIEALDFSPQGLQAMIRHIDAALPNETHLHRLKVFTEARAGLAQMAAGAPAPSDWFPIWDVFGYWAAAEEVIAARKMAEQKEG